MVPSWRPHHLIGWAAVTVLVLAIPFTTPDRISRGLLASLPIAGAQLLVTLAGLTGRRRLQAGVSWAAMAGLTGFVAVGSPIVWVAFAAVSTIVTTAAGAHGAGAGRLGLLGAGLAGGAMVAAGAHPITAVAMVAACEASTFTVGTLRSRLDLARASLDAAEQRFQALIDHAPYPIFVCDLQGWVTATNPAFTRTFGQVPARPGDVTWVGISDSADDAPAVADLARQIGHGPAATLAKCRFRHRSGRRFTADAHVSVLHLASGRNAGLLVQLDPVARSQRRTWPATSEVLMIA